MKLNLYLVIIFITIPVFGITQTVAESHSYSYSPSLDSLYVKFELSRLDTSIANVSYNVLSNNTIKEIKAIDCPECILSLFINAYKLNKPIVLNEFINLKSLSVYSFKKPKFSDDIKLTNLMTIGLLYYDYYKHLPKFVNQQNRLLGLYIHVENFESILSEIKAIETIEELLIGLPEMQDIPTKIYEYKNLHSLIILDVNEIHKEITISNNVDFILPNDFYRLTKLRYFQAPIDLSRNFSTLVQLSSLIGLHIGSCTDFDFALLEPLMKKLEVLDIEDISREDLESLRRLYPNVRINEDRMTRKEAHERGIVNFLE